MCRPGSTFFIILSVAVLFLEAPIIGSDLPLRYPAGTIDDTITNSQLLFNGRIVRKSYANIIGDEFLFTTGWLPGDVTINGITFHNLKLKYDIYNDELQVALNNVTVVQLNKELIKDFTLTIENKKEVFENFNTGNDHSLNGFSQVLYKGDIYLIIKYVKKIQQLAVNNRYDAFYQTNTLYILKEGNFYKVTGKKDLFNILSDKKLQIQKYIKLNKIRIRKQNPESFIPVLKFYDSLKNAV